ncbi:MAG TPA: hypothetical protein VFS59_18195 [Gemmatimonadaceae bacterium]|nr:hypothetical protein [Gemmatimonadaceae bacterium]
MAVGWLVFALAQLGDVEELLQFGTALATAAFGDVAADRYRGPPHLCGKAEPLLRRKTGS